MSAGGYGPPGGGYGGPPGGGYGGPPGGGYGGPPGGGYGAPPGGGYGAPPGGGYGAPPGGGYGAPPGGGYGAPPGGGYGAPPGGGYGAPQMGFGGGQGGGVEFGAAENKVIDGAATWSKTLGIVYFVQAALQLLNVNVIAAPISLFIGLGYWKGGTSLKHVTQTQGNDVGHLLDALNQFGSAFMIRIVCTIIVTIFVLIAFAIGLMVAVAANL